MWPFNRRKWILVIGYSNSENLYTDIKCISNNRAECVQKACKEVYEWYKHKQKVFGGHLLKSKLFEGLDDLDTWTYEISSRIRESLEHWNEDFQDTGNLELTWKSSHLQFYKISVRIFSSESDFIRIS